MESCMNNQAFSSRQYRALVALLLAVPLLTHSHLAEAAHPEAACFLQTSSILDTYASPPTGGDLDFFTGEMTGIPNIVILLDTSESMKGMPALPSEAGCGGPFLSLLQRRGYDPRADYWRHPPNHPDGAGGGVDCRPEDPYQTGGGVDDEYCDLFGSSGGVDAPFFRLEGPSGSIAGGAPDAESWEEICDDPLAPSYASCEACLNPANGTYRGFWRDSNDPDSFNVYFSGNLLNFFPPKYVSARRVMKDILNEINRVRLSTLHLNNDDSAVGADYFWTQGGQLFWPQCVHLKDGCGSQCVNQNERARNELREAINGVLSYDGFYNDESIVNALMRAGQLYTYNDHTAQCSNSHAFVDWFDMYNTGNSLPRDFCEKSTSSQTTVCDWCQVSSAIVITDGLFSLSNDLPMEFDAVSAGGLTDQFEQFARAAWWFQNHDLRSDYPDLPQVMDTFVVALTTDDTIVDQLDVAASMGGGFAEGATDLTELRDAILDMFSYIRSINSSFTTTELNNVQATASQSVIMPRLLPQRRTPWPGELFRFELLSEFALGLDADDHLSDGSGVFIVDRGCFENDNDLTPNVNSDDCGPIVTDPETGEFMRRTGANRWDLNDNTAPLTEADPFWEAGAKLKDLGSEQRNIWTVVYDEATGEPEVIEFSDANVERIAPYLGLTTTMDNRDCNKLLNMLNPSEVLARAKVLNLIAEEEDHLPLGALLGDACPPEIAALAVIRFVRGRLPDNSDDRDWLLSNIFHSSPTIIEPPTRPDLIFTPFRSDQTVVTLAIPDGSYFGNGQEVYEEFWNEYKDRDHVALVGSNGGFLHAFNIAECEYDEDEGEVLCNRGTGEELWAFAPPTLLPKLKHLVLDRRTQHFYVDGTPWVRNIWADGLGVEADWDYERSMEEYRTITVVGKRRGGRHFFALDVTNAHDPEAMWKDADAKNFLWVYPNIGDVNTLTQGQSWNEITPLPPPIVPIRLKDDNSDVKAGEPYGDDTFTERWVVGLPGGYDPENARGHGFHIVDVYTGKPIWQFTRHYAGPRFAPTLGLDPLDAHNEATSTSDLREHLRYSFAAPPNFAQWGREARQNLSNPYLDTMIIPDTGGQIWIARFHDPDPENWQAARLFEEYREDNANQFDIRRRPFFQSVRLSMMPETGMLRVNLGTGNRYHLRQRGQGDCGPDHLGACIRANCSNAQTNYNASIGSSDASSITWTVTDQNTMSWTNYSTDEIATSWCQNVDGFQSTVASGCGTGGGSSSYSYQCETINGVYQCWSEGDSSYSEVSCIDEYLPNRFYSIRVFGEGDRMPFNDVASADDFDGVRLTNRFDDGSGPTGEILDVTDGTTSVGHESEGWYIDYPVSREHTASPAVVAGRCVVWSSLEPPAAECEDDYVVDGGESDICGAPIGGQNAYMYFRNYITGAMDCVDLGDLDDGFGRVHVGSEPQPPPPPQAIVQVSPTGETRTTIFTGGEGIDVAEGDELYQEFGIISVPADVHDCRHLGDCE